MTESKPAKKPRTRTPKATPPKDTQTPADDTTEPAGTIYGYARVSTIKQGEKHGLSIQIEKLEKEKATIIFQEKQSGADIDRPQLAKLLDTVKTGDTIMVAKLDRLARSTPHLLQIIEQLKSKGVYFKSLGENIDTTTATGRAFLGFMAIIAELERETIKERTQAGIQKHKQLHGTWGRKGIEQSQLDHAKELLLAGVPNAEVSKKTGLKRSTIYHHFPADLIKSLRDMPQAIETPTPSPKGKGRGKPIPQDLPLYDSTETHLDNDWRVNGLNDEQFAKLQYYSGDFGDFNLELFLPQVEKGKSYLEILAEIKPKLQNPKTVTKYKGIDEILAK